MLGRQTHIIELQVQSAFNSVFLYFSLCLCKCIKLDVYIGVRIASHAHNTIISNVECFQCKIFPKTGWGFYSRTILAALIFEANFHNFNHSVFNCDKNVTVLLCNADAFLRFAIFCTFPSKNLLVSLYNLYFMILFYFDFSKLEFKITECLKS